MSKQILLIQMEGTAVGRGGVVETIKWPQDQIRYGDRFVGTAHRGLNGTVVIHRSHGLSEADLAAIREAVDTRDRADQDGQESPDFAARVFKIIPATDDNDYDD